jgi:type II secretory pathway pseudopilin PulG
MLQHRADLYVHGLLSQDEVRKFERGCESMNEYRSALDAAKARHTELESLPKAQLTNELLQRTLAAVDKQRSRPISKAFWALMAIAGVLFGVFHLQTMLLQPSPYDLILLGQNEWIAGSDVRLRIRLLDRDAQHGVAGVPVEIYLQKQPNAAVSANFTAEQCSAIATLQTDENGIAIGAFTAPDWVDGNYTLICRAITHRRRTPETISRSVRLYRSWQVMLSSDKPIYQPGQTIRLRSLALSQPQRKPVAGQETVFEVRDPKDNVIMQERTVTSRFGIASTDCELADQLIHGIYTIHCRVGDTDSSISVDVKPYQTPKFKITLDVQERFYQPGDLVRGTVRAEYLFGKPVVSAAVELQPTIAVSTDSDVEAKTLSLDQISTITDADGAASFECRLPGADDLKSLTSNNGRITLHIDITDTAGLKNKTTSEIPISTQPITIELVPEQGSLVAGFRNKIYLLTSYPDGSPAGTRVSIETIDQEVVTDERGCGSFYWTPAVIRETLKGLRELNLRVVDGEGRIVNTTVGFEQTSAPLRFLLRTDKPIYRGGESMRLTAMGDGDQPIALDFLVAGQTMATAMLMLSLGEGELVFDLPPQLAGDVDIVAYRMNDSVVQARTIKRISITPADEIAITVQSDKESYCPGDQARLQLLLRDRNNQPLPGAMSLSVVDEAVYAVSSDLNQTTTIGMQANESTRARYEQAVRAREVLRQNPRDEMLRYVVDTYLDGSSETLDALQSPDVAELIQWSGFPPEVEQLLLQRDAYHSLHESSYPAKKIDYERRKKKFVSRLKGIWVVFGIFAFFGGTIDLALRENRENRRSGCSITLVELMVIITIIGILLGLLTPAVNAARESASRSAASNAIRNLGYGLMEMQHREGLTTLTNGNTTNATNNPPRLRQYFPETLLWRPELISDNEGKVELNFDIADSITQWRVSASAVTENGLLGANQAILKVFQPFFVELELPVSLTRGDEITLPVAVFNYSQVEQHVELTAEAGEGIEFVTGPTTTMTVAAGSVGSAGVRIRANAVGSHALVLTALGNDGFSDALKRTLTIVPNGVRQQRFESGTLEDESPGFRFSVPNDHVPGSMRASVHLYPNTFGHVLDAAENIFRRPSGCFEQTSSTTYPNVLTLRYLQQTTRSKLSPQQDAAQRRGKQLIHLGYQRLLTFEVDGGGFDWFGNPPANRLLTAYGLREFRDMSLVHAVDPNLIERTREWLMQQRLPDGSWSPEKHGMESDPVASGSDPQLARLSTTAYIAASVYDADHREGSSKTFEFIRRHRAADLDSPYLLSLVAEALLLMDADGTAAEPYVTRLASLAQRSADSKQVFWQQAEGEISPFLGRGYGGQVETTAIATLALIHAGLHSDLATGGLAWLIRNQDEFGTWNTTQATILALQALVAGSERPLGSGHARNIDVFVDKQLVNTVLIPASEDQTVKQLDLTPWCTKPEQIIRLVNHGDNTPTYRLTGEYWVDDSSPPESNSILTIDAHWDRNQAEVGESILGSVKAALRTGDSIAMAMIELPIAPGWSVDVDSVNASQQSNIQKVERAGDQIVVYLNQLRSEQPFELQYTMRAAMPGEVTLAPARVYSYYQPEMNARSRSHRLTVR